MKNIVTKYGIPGGALFIGFSLADWALWYTVIKSGVDIKAMGKRYTNNINNNKVWDSILRVINLKQLKQLDLFQLVTQSTNLTLL